jgi:hypothetical protein
VSVMLVGAMAATVPALNVLFAEAVIGPAIRLPVVADMHPADKKRVVKSAGARVQEGALPQSARGAAPVVASVAMQHDEGLAAEHRAALDVLTESTGMDLGAAGEGPVAGLSGTAPGHSIGGKSPSSWTSVAVDAAERMRPLMGGRDSDDRH